MSEGTPITAEGLTALRAELERLEGEGRREIADRIRTAREWGDLKENAEYHAAKEEQAHLETRIAVLAERLRTSVVTEEVTDSSVVGFGSTVTVRDDASGRESTYKLVSAGEASPAEGRLSYESPVGEALRGAKTGQSVTVRTPTGQRTLVVVSVA